MTMQYKDRFKLDKNGIVLSTAISACLMTGAAHAALEEIVVTAQKRSESLQDVPVAVSAFTGESMKQMGVDDAGDLVSLTPGLSERAQSGSSTTYFLRGVGTNDIHLTAAPAVGMYLDGVTLTSGFQAKTSLFDVERVEILKGPQNTLFGLNTTGGTVSYFSNKPEVGAGSQGYLDARVGNHSRMNLEGALGFDLGPNSAARLSFASTQSDGAFTSVADGRDFGDEDTMSLRGQVIWQPSDDTSILFKAHISESENNGIAYKALGTRAPDGSGAVCADFNGTVIANFDTNTNCISRTPPGPGEQAGNLGADPSFANWETVGMNVGGLEMETRGISLRIDHDIEGATLTSITAFDNLEFENSNDLDGSQFGYMNVAQSDDRETFQQELRLVSNGDGAFRWIAGAYYLKDEADSFTGLRSALIGGWAILPNVQLDHSKENLGVYGQTEYDLSDAMTLTVGLRWSDETIEGHYKPSKPNVVGQSDDLFWTREQVHALVASNAGTEGYDADGYEIARQVTQELDNTDVGFTAKLDYQFGDDSLAYISFSRGFKGSALDIRAAYALVPVANVLKGLEDSRLDPESLDAWELGFKSTYWDNQLQLDAAVFQYTYENLQQFITNKGVPTLDNAPESEISGFDANVRYANDAGLYAQLGLSILDSEVTDSEGSAFVQGAPLAGAPELSYTALVSQDFNVGEGVLTVMANMSYTDEVASETSTAGTHPVANAFTADAYTLVNANATYRFGAAEQYSIGIYGNNLTNERFCHGIRASDNANLIAEGNTGHHRNLLCMVSNASVRTYGVTFGMDF